MMNRQQVELCVCSILKSNVTHVLMTNRMPGVKRMGSLKVEVEGVEKIRSIHKGNYMEICCMSKLHEHLFADQCLKNLVRLYMVQND